MILGFAATKKNHGFVGFQALVKDTQKKKKRHMQRGIFFVFVLVATSSKQTDGFWFKSRLGFWDGG